MRERIINLWRRLPLLPILVHNLIARRNLLLPLYRKKWAQEAAKGLAYDKAVYYMTLKETAFTGGLSDRLRGITSLYAVCKQRNLPFKIVFEPLKLTDYLVPNQYDWRTKDEEICWDVHRTYPCTILTYNNHLDNKIQRISHRFILNSYLRKSYLQYHVFTNMPLADDHFSELFHELFKPSKALQAQLDHHLSRLGGKGAYLSLTFRFRQLLGDFKEGGYILPEVERKRYISKCLKGIEQVHLQYPQEKILVTSDSVTFLNKAKKLPFIYVIPGEVVHIGFTFDATQQVYMKSFVDYFMISYAKKVYQAADTLLFNSGFPQRAAMLNHVPYAILQL